MAKEATIGYTHFVPPAKLNPDFKDGIKYTTVTTLQQLKEVLLSAAKYVAWDVETSSLNHEEGFIVGLALAWTQTEGFYVPIKHHNDISLGDTAIAMFHKMLLTRKMTFLYNARFDMRFMERFGYNMSKVPVFDVQVPVWNSDTNWKRTNLKWAELHFLGWPVTKFEEALGESENFYYVPVVEATPYAAQDAVGLLALANKVMQYHQESKQAGKIDQQQLYPLMHWEQELVNLSEDYLRDLRTNTYARLKDLEHQIYQIAGTVYKINSNRDQTEVFTRLGIDTGQRIKSGYMKITLPILKQMANESPHPILKLLIEYKELFKSMNSYMDPLLKEAQEKGGGRFAYQTCLVPTARYASGKDGKNTFYSPINTQSIPKPSPKMWYVREATQEEIDKQEDILGYHFSLTEKTDRMVEAFDTKDNVRMAFITHRKDAYWVSMDMEGEELRIVANLYKEPTWVNAFLHGEDVHKQTAIAVFGENNYDKSKRKMAKVVNFGKIYGMTASSMKEKFPELTIDFCEKFMEDYVRALPYIFGGQDRDIRRVKKEGTVYTVLGRPRRVGYYLKHADKKKRGFGVRTVKNTQVQGAAGDLLRLMLVKTWRALGNESVLEDGRIRARNPYDVRWRNTVHDEVNWSVPREHVLTVMPILIKCMTVEVPGWPVPLTCGLEVGTSWGQTFPFEYDLDKGTYTPKWEHVKEEEPEPEVEIRVDNSQFWAEGEDEDE